MVTVEPESFDMCVVASSVEEAKAVALKNARAEHGNLEPDFHAGLAYAPTILEGVPHEWRGAIPYGEANDATVEELFQPIPEPAKEKP